MPTTTTTIHLLINLQPHQEKYLKLTLKALLAQEYNHWYLSIIADFNTTDKAIWEIKNLRWRQIGQIDTEATRTINHEIDVIQADWVALIEAGDSFEPNLLSHCIRYNQPDWQLIYVDEDSISTQHERYDPKFKPDFNLDLLRAMPYLGNFCLLRREALQTVGGYAPNHGMENYDIALKILDHYGKLNTAIGHIAQMLYHRLDIQHNHYDNHKNILRQHLKRNAIHAEIHNTEFPGIHWIDYPLQDNALISIIIATRNSVQSLQRCLHSLIKITTYSNYEIILVGSFDELKLDSRIKVLPYTAQANISKLNNLAAQQANGEYLLFLNDDTEIIQAKWLQRLLAINQRQEIGIVGARLLDAKHNVFHAGLILGMGAAGVAGQIHQGLAYNDAGYMGRNQAAQNLSAVSDACLMIKKSLYQEIAGMDENAVLFNEIDLCLKVAKKAYKIVWTPHVDLLQHGLGSLIRNRGQIIKNTQVEQEIVTMHQKWLPQLCNDQAYNPHLCLRDKDKEWQPENQIDVPWDVNDKQPRIVAFPYNAWGTGEYRVRAPLRALHQTGLANYALMPNEDEHRLPTLTELERMQADTLLLHNSLSNAQLKALEQYQRFNHCFKIFGQDDLTYALPKTNPYYQTNYKDIKQRIHKALSISDRLIVTTEPLADAYRQIIGDIKIIPNYLERSRWANLTTQRRQGRQGQKPRVGWAGAAQHLGDLQIIIPLVKELADEIEWIFFGLCPEKLRPYVHEYYDMVSFEQYPAKLASLNLDLAIAPLEKNAFNEAKSNLRLLEYGILGYPVVCSDIYPYQDAPVARVDNTPSAWINAIRERVSDLEATFEEGNELKRWVLKHWMLDEHLDEWAQAFSRSHALRGNACIDAPRRVLPLQDAERPCLRSHAERGNENPRWIFILGGAHSGTDLLDSLLRQHESIVGNGDEFFAGTMSEELKIPELWTEQETIVRFSAYEKSYDIEQKKTAWLQSTAPFIVARTSDSMIARALWLQRHFPGAYFILMVRNGFACALDCCEKVQTKHGLQPLLLHRAARQWARSLAICLDSTPEQFLEIRYEDLMDNPNCVTNRLFDFLNLPHIKNLSFTATFQNPAQLQLAQISAEQWAIIKNGAGDMLALYGYVEKNTETQDELARDYSQWIEKYDTISKKQCQQLYNNIQQWQQKPLISVLMPVYNTVEKWLRIAITSVREQIYPYWELCIADDASTKAHIRAVLEEFAQLDKRIKVVFREQNGHISAASNSALAMATGEFIALMDHDDKLPIHAFYKVAEMLNQCPDSDLIYSDEDKLDEFDHRYGAYFKSDWNPDLFYSQNLISHLGVYRRTLVNKIGGFRLGYEGSQDYDLALRVIELTNRIRHIPQVLYHWRAIAGSTALDNQEKPYATITARKAIQSHFERLQKSVKVVEAEVGGHSRVIYPLPKQPPLVSLIILTRDKLELLHTIVDGILNETDYKNIELVIIDSGSVENKTLAYLEKLKANSNYQVTVIRHDAPFNYPALNNMAVSKSSGEIIGLLSSDLEVISPNWLTEMVSHALRAEIGAVGAKLYYSGDTIQHAGVILGLGGVAGHSHQNVPRKSAGYCGKAVLIQNYSAVTGACMVLRRKVFEEVEGLDEKNLKVAFNDVDLCLRIQEKGYRILWTPYAELYHLESASRGIDDSHSLRFQNEVNYMKSRWGEKLFHDPYYNPNLILHYDDFSLA